MKSMRDIKKDLLKRRDELGRVKGYAENKLSRAPKGSLRTSVNKGLTRYYEVEECGDTRGKYINAKNLKRAKALAEKDYYQKLVKQAQKELNGIEILVLCQICRVGVLILPRCDSTERTSLHTGHTGTAVAHQCRLFFHHFQRAEGASLHALLTAFTFILIDDDRGLVHIISTLLSFSKHP